MSLAVALALSLAASPTAARAALRQDDPLTGIWEGLCTGPAPVPPEGVPFSLRLEHKGEDEALATLTMQGANTPVVAAEYDAESGELTFRCNLTGILIDVELVVAGEELTGKATGLGMSVVLTGKRTARELPAPDTSTPDWSAPRTRVDLTTLGPADWRADLAQLAEELPRRHANAFHALTKEEWQRRVRELDGRLAGLTPAESAVALAQLVAAVGDAHTELDLAGPPFDRAFPLRLTWFEDGLFVTGVDERFEPALAAEVRRVGNKSAAEALNAVRTLFAAENEFWPRVVAPPKLALPALLAALRVTASADSIPLVVAGPDGADVAVTIDGSGSGKWLVAPDPALVAPPLWRRRMREAYWFAPVADGHALYWAYNRCGEDPAHPMKGFVDEILAALARPGVERLVIDLRHNSGGNSAVLSTFLPALAAHPRLAAPGSLRVLIGAETYSSGMTNAFELRDQAHARLYGTPTGGKPNSYGELRVFRLSRSGLDVYHSTKLIEDLGGADTSSVEPDVRVATTSADWFAGVDPVLERALARE